MCFPTKSILWSLIGHDCRSLEWRHNEHDEVPNHQPYDCLLNSWFGGEDQRKHQSSASLAFVRGIHRSLVNSPHKGPVTRKMFPFHDFIIMVCRDPPLSSSVHILLTCITPFEGNMRHEVALELNESDSLLIRIHNLWQKWPSYNQKRDHIGKSMPDVYLIQLQWPSGKSQACHAEGPLFALGTPQGVLFPVAAHHTTLAWQWARDWGAFFTYHLGDGRPLVAGDK